MANETVKRLFIVTNEGLHPIKNKLKRQFGEDFEYREVTYGNTPFSPEYSCEVAKKTRDICMDNDDKEIHLVFSGLPIYNLVVFETIRKMFNKVPVVLVYNRDTGLYDKFEMDVRKLLFG